MLPAHNIEIATANSALLRKLPIDITSLFSAVTEQRDHEEFGRLPKFHPKHTALVF
jgi:hypothetical protein